MGDDRDDAELVRECLGGRRAAFEVLLARHEAGVYRGVYRILHDSEDAREVTQDVFLKAYRSLESFDPTNRFFSWLYRIAVNEALNHRRRYRPEAELDADAPSPEPSPESTAESSEARRCLEDALMSLRDEQRVPVVLKHVLGCSYEEIAEILGISPKTVKSRLFSARQALCAALARRGFTR